MSPPTHFFKFRPYSNKLKQMGISVVQNNLLPQSVSVLHCAAGRIIKQVAFYTE